MKTFISSLAIAAAIITLSACTKSHMAIPTDPNVEAPQASRNFSEHPPIVTDSFPTAPMPKPRIDLRP